MMKSNQMPKKPMMKPSQMKMDQLKKRLAAQKRQASNAQYKD